MTGNEILKADLLDILFDNRNKLYGAYTIRRFYNNRLATALVLSIISVFITLLLLAPANTAKPVKDDERIFVRPMEMPVQKPIEKPVPKAAQPATTPVAQNKFVDNIKIETDNKVTDLAPDLKSLENAVIGDKTTPGAPADGVQSAAINAPQAAAGNVVEEDVNNFKVKESSPEFPGGQAAWMRFLSKYLKAPEGLAAGEKKTVMVRFFVDIEGSINHFEVVQSGGLAFDNEVIRVLQKMPKWKPAVQNGRPVPVTFTQPVTFVGMEE